MAYPEILILRHLSRRPAHGYELRKRIEETTGIVINNNSLYPALKRFVEAGAVRMTVEQHESKPPRHVYELTDVGRELLHDLLSELPVAQAGDDLEFLTRLGQFAFLDPDERVTILDVRATALSARRDRLAALAERAPDEFWGSAVIARLRAQTEAELHWLDELGDQAARP
ncbi:PadR family transcriptional regulator [Microbacterium terrisoli]|jgi:DNA-binding PadR family transcriptional regulator|uniref:PadR family transcriptional regulator n=1 Tax=Microbacterium terrisoli TaxID=3242192 RepID=UPI002804D5D0|nr:PadR family transcriptional regulator [Microbacterium protaetiae]